MQINIDKNIVEFKPEGDGEAKKLEELWKVVVDCVRFNKKLAPIGEYTSQKNDFARFAIEGLDSGNTDEYAEIYADEDCTCYCQTCNKYINLKAKDRIPPCCGKLMEVFD